ncbi:TPA: hypothetical protein N0F65_008606 [Lagenidium giganteum]|uniref:Uncharacterized protein n=1 Tax=Lagenidium giganteum TaxID=4803 RepID=A0AAV2Z378_9STRA|nr:TPA: hypothetical protein N0F65_008606 [Lagenidium giganteum]
MIITPDVFVSSGMEAAEHLEVKKLRLEKELRRRSQDFRDLMSTRNSDIQEEYARMLKELEEQVELLTQQVASEKARKQQFKRRRKRGREDDSEVDAQANAKARDLHHENEQMKHHIEEFTHNIRQLQTSYTALERELNGANAEPSTDPLPAADVAAEEALASEVATLKQEVELLRRTKADAEELAARKASEKSEPNDPAPKDAMEEEATTLRDQLSEISSQLSASSVRLQSLLRSLAPAPSIGSLMTRLHQQLATKDDTQPGKRKTVEMDVFLKSCPSADEGRKAIELMKTLQLIYCYEASGVIALAD